MNKYFRVKSKDNNSRVRAGEIKTENEVVEPPCFIPDVAYGGNQTRA